MRTPLMKRIKKLDVTTSREGIKSVWHYMDRVLAREPILNKILLNEGSERKSYT